MKTEEMHQRCPECGYALVPDREIADRWYCVRCEVEFDFVPPDETQEG